MTTAQTQGAAGVVDGGPAFPRQDQYPQQCLSVRQYYKAAALQGLLATAGHTIESQEPYLSWLLVNPSGAKTRYLPDIAAQLADAMLAEDAEFASRTKEPPHAKD